MRIFGIDPGSERTGYGCVETDGRAPSPRHLRRHHAPPPATRFPQRLARIHRELAALLAACAPDCVAIESLFHAVNARSALKLGHARGVAMLAAVEAGCPVVEYTPAEIKRAVVGYGRAEKHQVQQMIKLLLGLDEAAVAARRRRRAGRRDLSSAFDATAGDRRPRTQLGADRIAGPIPVPGPAVPTASTWRQYRPPASG